MTICCGRTNLRLCFGGSATNATFDTSCTSATWPYISGSGAATVDEVAQALAKTQSTLDQVRLVRSSASNGELRFGWPIAHILGRLAKLDPMA